MKVERKEVKIVKTAIRIPAGVPNLPGVSSRSVPGGENATRRHEDHGDRAEEEETKRLFWEPIRHFPREVSAPPGCILSLPGSLVTPFLQFGPVSIDIASKPIMLSVVENRCSKTRV